MEECISFHILSVHAFDWCMPYNYFVMMLGLYAEILFLLLTFITSYWIDGNILIYTYTNENYLWEEERYWFLGF